MNIDNIKVIAFDADDTLWVNETIFRNAEKAIAGKLEAFAAEEDVLQLLLDTEIKNLDAYGYGIKGFVLSCIEAAQEITGNTLDAEILNFILDIGKAMLAEPVELLPEIEEVLKKLSKKYRLVVATKGDLLDQERKLIKSGLMDYFHHIEIVSDKKEHHYRKLVKHLDIQPEEFLMVGNSLRSDILPVLAMGGFAFHIPFHMTWAHEVVTEDIEHPKFKTLEHANEMLQILL